MKKRTSIVLLSILSVLIAFIVAVTFAQFSFGANKQKVFNGVLGAIELDYGMEANSVYTLELDKTSDDPEDIKEVLDTLSFRLNELGYQNYSVKAVKNTVSSVYDIRIEINANSNNYNQPDTDTLSADMETVVAFGKLQFFGGAESSPTETIFDEIDNPIESVKYAGYDSASGNHLIAIQFTKDAYNVLEENMEAGDFYLKVSLGDEKVLLSGSGDTGKLSPSYFTNRTLALVSGSEAGAKQMVLQIKSGGLDYKYQISSVSSISSTLRNASLLSVIAIASIIVLSVVALAVLYKGFGLVSFLSLLLFILIDIFMFIAVPGVKLSIGSVVGIALATVIAVDGLALIIKRISEEYQSGKTVKSAIRLGFKRALVPTITIGVIAVVLSLTLVLLASGQVYSFAVAFGIGGALATISSLLFTRMFMSILLGLTNDKQGFLNLKRDEQGRGE